MPEQREGRLAENILLFARTLRSAGLPIGTVQVIDALQAVVFAGLESRSDLYWGLRAQLVNRPAQIRLFDQAFHMYFRNPRLLERMMSMLLPSELTAMFALPPVLNATIEFFRSSEPGFKMWMPPVVGAEL